MILMLTRVKFMPFAARKTALWCLLLFATGACKTQQLMPSATQTANTEVNAALAPDTAYENIIKPYRAKLEADMSRNVGSIATELTKTPVESTMGNAITDLTRAEAIRLTGQPVDMALVTLGGLRINLRPGPVSLGDIYELSPFEDELVVVTLSGPQVYKMFLYLAASKNAAAANTQALFKAGIPQSLKIGGQPLDTTRSYTIATTKYLSHGGDKMDFFLTGATIKGTGTKFRDVIINQLEALKKQGKSLNGKLEGRLVLQD